MKEEGESSVGLIAVVVVLLISCLGCPVQYMAFKQNHPTATVWSWLLTDK